VSRKKVRGEIADYKGMKWENVCTEVQRNALPLLMSRDWVTVEAGRSADICQGEAGAAVVVAGLCCKDWGPEKTARKGVEIYEGIKKRKGLKGMEHHFNEMLYWTAWLTGGVAVKKWPVRIPEWDDDDKWGGLANVMLHVSAKDLMEDGASNSRVIASRSIVKFLQEGMSMKSGKKVVIAEGI